MAGPFAPGGLIGPLFPRRRARMLEEAASRDRAETVSNLDIGVDELVSGTGDPEVAAAFQDQFKSFQRMALSSDKKTQEEGINGLGTLATAVRGAIEKKRTDQSGRVMDAAKDMREKAQAALEPMRKLQANVEQIDALLGDKDFDQNLALNRGQLISLLQSSTRQMLSDPDDFADALHSVNGGGLLGSLVGLAAGTLAAEDFNFTKEDYRRLADAAYTFQQKKYTATIAPIERDAQALEQAAASLDMFPKGYSLSNYILSDPEQFTKPLRASYPEPAPKVPTLGTVAAGGAVDGLRNLLNNATMKPINEAGARADEQAPLAGERFERAPGVNGAPRVLGDLFSRMDAYPDGTTFKADPTTGRVFAYTPDGKRTEVETTGGWFGSGGQRAGVREWLATQAEAARRAPKKGVIRR